MIGAALTALFGLLAACGGDEANPGEESGESSTAASAADEETATDSANDPPADEQDTAERQDAAEQQDPDAGNPDGDAGDDDQEDQPEPDGQAAGDVVDDALVARLTDALLALDSDEVMVDAAAAACSAESLSDRLDPDVYEVLVLAVEDDRNFDDDDPVTDADVRTISESFVSCIDFSVLVASLEEELGNDGELVSCLRSSVGEETVTTELVYQLLNEQRTSSDAPLLVEGLASCPTETKPLVTSLVVDDIEAADQDAAAECVAELPTETLREVVDGTLGPNPDYVAFIERHCPNL